MSIPSDEMDTSMTMSGSDRNTWHVYSDDPVLQRRIEKAGATLVRTTRHGKFYSMRADQIVFRTGKRELSEAQKAQLAKARQQVSQNPAPAEV